MNAEKEVLIFGDKSMYKCLEPILKYLELIYTTVSLRRSELSNW